MAVRAMSITRHKRPHIRLLRRRAGLTQRELAFLLGHKSHSQISRFEHGRRVPAADELLQLEIIFGVVPGGVFPHLRDEAANAVLVRIEKLQRANSSLKRAGDRADRPLCRAVHLDRILESIRRQQAPGLNAHEPWPKAILASETESEER